MTTIKTVLEAIAALKDRTGSSVIAINKWVESEKKVRKQTDNSERVSDQNSFGAAPEDGYF